MAAAGADGAILPLVTLAQRFSEASMDPLKGNVAGWNALTRPDGLTPAECRDGIVEAAVESVPVLLGFFKEDGHPHGRARAAVGAQRYRGIPGQVSPLNGQVFAINTEVAHGMAGLCCLPPENFGLCLGNGHVTFVPTTLARTLELVQGRPADDPYIPSLAPVAGAEADNTIIAVKARMIQALPHGLAALVVGRVFTRIELFLLLAPIIIEKQWEETLPHLCNFLKMSVITRSAGMPHVPLIGSTPPLMEPDLAEFLNKNLRQLLPDAFAPSRNRDQTAMVNLFVRQEELATAARLREEARRTKEQAPKTVEDMWTPDCLERMCRAANVSVASNLPKVYAKVAAAPEKRRRQILEENCREIALECGGLDMEPLVTPTISKRVFECEWLGHEVNDLSQGLHPFLMAPRDLSTLQKSSMHGELAEATKAYDMVLSGGQSITYQDSKDLTSTTAKYVLPLNLFTAARQLECFGVLLSVTFGPQHALTTEVDAFADQLTRKIPLYTEALSPFGVQGPAVLLFAIHLRLALWHKNMLTAKQFVPVPKLREEMLVALELKLAVQPWASPLPAKYQAESTKLSGIPGLIQVGGSSGSVGTLSTGGSSSGSSSGSGGSTADMSAATGQQKEAHNLQYLDMFQPYRKDTRSFKDMKKPEADKTYPKTARGQVCLAWHLKGRCYTNCKREKDHKALSDADAATLLAWAQKNLAPQL